MAGCSAESETLFGPKIEIKVDPMNFMYRFASTIRRKINRILKLDHFVNYCFSKIIFLTIQLLMFTKYPQSRQISQEQ